MHVHDIVSTTIQAWLVSCAERPGFDCCVLAASADEDTLLMLLEKGETAGKQWATSQGICKTQALAQ